MCHCIDCYRLYNQRKEAEEVAAAKRRTKSDVPWTEDWFDQIREFRKKSFWECH
eukprot:09647.XXX_523842_524003_1 [CDS] Oithona nana genome sequencing.